MVKQYCLYVVHFDDHRIKVGITADVRQRMAYYRQEARRNRVDSLCWWSCPPFNSKSTALLAERVLCRAFAESALPFHREWFNGDSRGFKTVLDAAESLRKALAHEDESTIRDLPYLGRHGSFRGLAA